MAPKVSIIVPTHNRAVLLTEVITLLMKQSVPASEYEIVICDSASSDATPETIGKLSAQFPNVRGVRLDKPGASIARNGGLDAASGQLIVLVDDDIYVQGDFVEVLLKGAAANPGCVLLGFIEAPWADSTDPFLRFLWQTQDVNRYDFADANNVSAEHFYTACVAMPREVLGTHRFDENFTGAALEDTEFGIRLLTGQRMVYLPDWRVRHEFYPDYEGYRRRKFKLGKALGYFVHKDPKYAAYFYVEPNWTRRWYRLYVRIMGPFGRWMLRREAARKRKGPLPSLLHTFLQRDLRVQLYDGMREYARQSVQHKPA
ncbi:MAG TPA: glycosyltransferase [Planctomycetota bacterium]|nr:glycosyltransferase [Planctomycetota bacterium]